jgi:outer membrane protein OmpA-like peptidoglycan-associated protein
MLLTIDSLHQIHRFSVACASVLFLSSLVFAQSDQRRQTVAVTYPLDRTVTVQFRGTTRLPRLTGTATVRRTTKRNTRVELSVRNLPRANELGGIYTTYVLWAITPEGRADNLGEIKRSNLNALVSSKLDVTTPYQTFALIVTAEPHFAVRTPSRMVVLENLPPVAADNGSVADVTTVNVNYIGNSSDYFRDARVPEIPEPEFQKMPPSLLGARQAVALAQYAGAERDAPNELKDAQYALEQAELAFRSKLPNEEVDTLARKAIVLGAKAEDAAETHKAARLRREETLRRDEELRRAENIAANNAQQVAELRRQLDEERRQRELVERDLANAKEQVVNLRSENSRLRDELQAARTEGESAKVTLARIEGERQAEIARQEAERRAAEQRQAYLNFKQALARFGAVRETSSGLVLTLNESLWTAPRASNISPRAMANTVTPLAALLANNPNYQITIESYTDGRGAPDALRQLTQTRADALANQFTSAGVDSARIKAVGMAADNPLAPNTTVAGRNKNRRTEITLTMNGAAGNIGQNQ